MKKTTSLSRWKSRARKRIQADLQTGPSSWISPYRVAHREGAGEAARPLIAGINVVRRKLTWSRERPQWVESGHRACQISKACRAEF